MKPKSIVAGLSVAALLAAITMAFVLQYEALKRERQQNHMLRRQVEELIQQIGQRPLQI